MFARNSWLELNATTNIQLRGERMVLGRGARCDVFINAARVSREHCFFTCEGPTHEWWVADSGSTGGTFLRRANSSERHKISKTKLINGDAVLLMSDEITFRSFEYPVVNTHFAPLDSAATDEASWQIWVDALLERGDDLGAWLANPPTTLERFATLGASIEDPSQHTERWNVHGFLTAWQLSASFFLKNPTCCEPKRTPAARYLSSLELSVDANSVIECLRLLRDAPLPRSLRHLGVTVSSVIPEPHDEWRSTVAAVKAKCPLAYALLRSAPPFT